MSLLPEAKGAKEEALALQIQGKAVARGIAEANAQKDRNTAKEAKRRDTMLRNAADKMLNRSFSS